MLPSQVNFSEGQRQPINEEVLKLLEKGAIVKAQHCPGEFISNLFLVPKKTGDLRPVINLKPLNKFVVKRHFKMETISVARELINSNDHLASVDLSDAYFSIPIHESYRKFLRFIWKEQLYEFVCLPFGYSLAPRTFTKVLKPLYSLLRSNGMKVCYYIDDTLIIAASKAECSANVHKVIRLLGDLGFKINLKKSQLDPVTQLTYLGFILDSSTMTISLPEDKIEKIISKCSQLHQSKIATIRQVAEISGLLVSAFPAVRYLQLFYRSVEACKSLDISAGADYDDRVPITELARSDLLWVIENIRRYNGKLLREPAFSHSIESDASSFGWGARYNTNTTGGRWSIDEAKHHINYLELLAAFHALQCFAPIRSRISLLTDNSTVVGYINKMGRMASPSLNHLTRKLWVWCLEREIFVVAQHIPGKDNVYADYHSRNFNERFEWSLNLTVFRWITQRLWYPEIDLFASRLNAKVKKFVSWYPDPEACAVDAFTIDWETQLNYAFPPFSLIPRVLSKVQQDQACVLLVAPVWTCQIWYPLLLRLLIERPVLLPRWRNLMTQPHNGKPHPLRHQIHLAVWPVSGESSRIKAFQKTLVRSSSNPGLQELKNNTTNPGESGLAGVIDGRVIFFKHL